MSREKDYIERFFRQKLLDYSLEPINSRFRWAVLWIVLIGVIGSFFKGLVSASLAGVLIVAALAWRRIRIQDAKFEMAMEEIRYRFEITNEKTVDVHTSIGYIYGENLGLTSEEGFDPLALLWKKKRAITEDLSIHISRLGYKRNDDGTYRLYYLTEDGKHFYHGGSLSADELSGAVGEEVAQKIISGEGEEGPDRGLIEIPVAILSGGLNENTRQVAQGSVSSSAAGEHN